MRKFVLVVCLTAGVLGLAGSASAAPDFQGPTGSTYDDGTGQVVCGHAPDNFLQDPVAAYNNGRGVEVCADGGLGPIQGRVFIDGNQTPTILGTFYGIERIHGDIDSDTPIIGMSSHFLNIETPFLDMPFPF